MCTMHTFTIQGVDQGPSINNNANQGQFIIGQAEHEPYIYDLPTSRGALFHSIQNKDLSFIEQCTIVHIMDGLKLAKNTISCYRSSNM
jgi:hypothetical protein